MKQAEINCPHCGTKITIRQKTTSDINPADQVKIFVAADEMFKAMTRGFAKLFHPSLWK